MPRTLTLAAAAAFAGVACASAQVSFSSDIQPILESSCLKCHGAKLQLSKLDLRTREGALRGGSHGPALVPGDPEASRLFRMASGAEKPAMPMDGKLSEAQVGALREWIAQGAPWGAVDTGKATASEDLEAGSVPEEARKYWAFQKPKRAEPPQGVAKHPLDAFLLSKLREQGLKPAPTADARTLVRRAYLDLIGLPPTPAEVKTFVDDRAPDAWERLIDRLLASPHYGERWGRHWLDVARYADSNGYEHDFDRPNAWRYRDYVVRAFNADKPWSDFLREQIAGDEIDTVTHDSLIATGFLRNYAKVGYREKDNPEFRYEYLDDMIATIGRGVLGLTVQCARCHNHKFDPIPQRDYYQLQASLFGYVEVDHPLVERRIAEEYEAKLKGVNERLNELRAEIRKMEQPARETLLQQKYRKFPPNVQAAIAKPERERTPGEVLLANQVIRNVGVSSSEIDRVLPSEVLAAKRKLLARMQEIEKERPAPIPVAMGITDGDYRFTPDGPGDEPAPGKGVQKMAVQGTFLHTGAGKYVPPTAHFLIRGDVNSKGSVMQPGFVTVGVTGTAPTELPPAHGRTSGRRRALAEWLVSPDNPLTARVIVNRIWHHHFGRGLVQTLDNFGKMGEAPTHPELLDWLALNFIERGWSVKAMHRLLMTSEAYRMSSQFGDAANLAKDGENRYGWRFRARRLDAEIVRDSILAVSGTLNRSLGGQPIFPELPGEVLSQMKHGIWRNQADGPEVWRRSIYIYRKRGLPFPMLEAFDLPDQNVSCGARTVSTVPTQALVLMNDVWVLRQAELFAGRIRESGRTDPVGTAWALALAREPSHAERTAVQSYLDRGDLNGLAHVILNLNEFAYLR